MPLSQLVIRTAQEDKAVIGEESLGNTGNKTESACGKELKVIKNTIVKFLWRIWTTIFSEHKL